MDLTTTNAGESPVIDRQGRDEVRQPATPRRSRFPKFLSGLIITLGVILLKLKDVAFFLFERGRMLLVNPFEGFGAWQYAVAGGSMIVTIVAYGRKYPVGLVLGFVLITLIHEIGHAVVIRAKGLRAGFMVFIPFIGGAVTLKDQPRSAYDDAQIGLAGPIAGTIASLLSLQVYKWTGSDLYLSVAAIGFFLNLLNLIPLGMLDGGRISAAITKWMWVLGGAPLVYKTYKQPNPLMILLLVLAAFQVYAAILRERDDKVFYDVTLGQRAGIAATYFALVVFLGHQTYMAAMRLELLTGR